MTNRSPGAVSVAIWPNTDDIEVVGEAANGISAVEQINELHPDIVFLDVQMPDLDGFGVIENVEPSTGPAPVYIFVTAHDAHAIRAFEVHAVDYLLKPYDKERFAKGPGSRTPGPRTARESKSRSRTTAPIPP
jgi:two-component system LytT family response regulator